jgi:ubiquinone/menaquinone biosynthesis C-methylase UbiE
MNQRITSLHSLFDFEPMAREYDRWYKTPTGQNHDRVQKEDVRCLLQPAPTGERLLDVGCGTGHWSSFFAELGYQVTGIDISAKMIEVARAAAPECSFRVADACQLPFSDASFDVVASMATMEFIPDPANAIREIVRCAKPGGILLIGTLNRLAALNRRRLSEGKQPYASAHLFSPSELRTFLARWGPVRTLASSPRFSPQRSTRLLPLFGEELDGPFIVAEVSL